MHQFMTQCIRGRILWLFGPLAMGLAIGLAGLAVGHEGEADATKARGENTMTLRPFADVEKQEFPWGWIAWTMNDQIDPNATMTFGVVYLKPHQTNALHRHPNADEILHVLTGSLEHRMGEKWVKMGPGDSIRIPKGMAHNARTADEACQVVVVYDTGARQFVEVDEKESK